MLVNLTEYQNILTGPTRGGVYGVDVISLAAELDEIHEIPEVTARVQRFAEDLGSSHIICFKVPALNETLDACLHTSTAPKRWLETYIEKDYVRIDPLIKHAVTSPIAFHWSGADEYRPPSRVELFLKDRDAFGLRDEFVVPIHESNGSTAIVQFSCDGDLKQEFRTPLAIAGHCLYSKMITVTKNRISLDSQLTTREIECLQWAAQGKSDWEIGSILNTGGKAVNYHIERVKKKLGVSTRIQAIIHAIRQGHIALSIFGFHQWVAFWNDPGLLSNCNIFT